MAFHAYVHCPYLTFYCEKLTSSINCQWQEIGGREIKVNITEKPLQTVDFSLFQAEESQFVESPHKVYVGNLAKTVTTEMLKSFFSEKGKVLSAKVSRVPGTSKSSGFGFVSFSSEEDVEAAISSLNNTVSCLLPHLFKLKLGRYADGYVDIHWWALLFLLLIVVRPDFLHSWMAVFFFFFLLFILWLRVGGSNKIEINLSRQISLLEFV